MDSKLGYGKLDQSGRCAWQAIIAFVFDMTYYVGERDKDLKETYPEGVTSNDNAFETAFPLDCSNKTIITFLQLLENKTKDFLFASKCYTRNSISSMKARQRCSVFFYGP